MSQLRAAYEWTLARLHTAVAWVKETFGARELHTYGGLALIGWAVSRLWVPEAWAIVVGGGLLYLGLWWGK